MLVVLCILVSDFGEGHSLEGGNVMLEIKEGKPYLWRTLNYGDIAVHLVSVNETNGVLKISIDGGADTSPAQRYPELADGETFTLANKLFRREPRVRNTVRNVPGVGKVAVVTTDKPRIALDAPYTADELMAFPAHEVQRYARAHFSTIGKLTKKADIIAAIRAQETKQQEVTF